MVPLRYNIRSLMVRKVTTLATAFGIALVVFVFGAAKMLSAGIDAALSSSGRPDVALVLRQGSDAEMTSGIQNDLLGLLASHNQVDSSQGPGVIGETVIIVTADRSDGSGVSNVTVRGTPPGGIAFRPEIKVTQGRLPAPGTNEVIIGQGIAGRFKGMAVGQSFDLRRNRPLTVVGVFESGGTSAESEVFGDLDTIRTSLGRQGVVSSARVKLTSPGQFEQYKAAIEGDKQLGMKVMREQEYFAKQSEQMSGMLVGMGIAIAVLFSIAAMLGAAITMNGAVANRTREIGTLRALGFSRLGILASFVFEAIFLAFIGGVIGVAFVMLMGMVSFSTMNFATFSEIVIGFKATPGVVISSLIFAGVMGLLGGLVPAIRASRVAPAAAMRG